MKITSFIRNRGNRIKNLACLVVFTVLAFLSLLGKATAGIQSDPDHYAFTQLQTDGVESIGAIWAIVQGPQGFMWFGGENGLARFDGYQIKIYRNTASDPNSLSSSYIFELLVDRQGRLWVGTTYGLNLYRPGTDDFERFMHEPANPHSLAGNGIRCLLQDSAGYIWIGHGDAGLTRFDVNKQQFLNFRHRPGRPESLAENNIQSLAEDKQGALWIGLASQGLDRLILKNQLQPEVETFQHFRHSALDELSLSDDNVRSLWVDRLSSLWVGTTRGVNRFVPATESFIQYLPDDQRPNTLNSNVVQDIKEDSEGRLWLATEVGGLNLYRRETNDFIHFSHDPADKASLFNNNIRAIYLDQQGNFWLGHFAAGVSMLDNYASAFKNYYHNSFDANSINYSEVVAVAENSDGNLWVGTARGLNLLNRTTGKVQRFLHDKNDPSSINEGGVLGLLFDSRKRLWAGLWAGGLNRLDEKDGDFKHYNAFENSDNGLFNNTIWALAEDSAGVIWAGHHMAGLVYYNESADNFERVASRHSDPNGIECDSVFSVHEDRHHNLWVGCSNGLNLRQAGQTHFEHFFHMEGQENSLSANHIWAVTEDSNGTIWIGTHGGGVNKFIQGTQQFVAYRKKDGLADDLVTGIVEDNFGYLWFITGNGLSRFDPKTEQFLNFDARHGLPGNVFNRSAALKLSSGELVFGSKDGLTLFNPKQLKLNLIPPQLVLTDFQLFNRSANISDQNTPLGQSITQTKELTLRYDQSSFSIQFSALNYRVPSMNRYAYKLDGFDQDWIDAGARRWAYYTNLDPGEYQFQVKAANNEGVWNDQGRNLKILIIPPWWQTSWAYLGYAVVLVVFIGLVTTTLWQRKIAEQERRVSARLRDIDKIKNAFLANTSHELRTPLHGIIGLAESLYEGVAGKLPFEAQHYLGMIIISGRRLANLVNDILDFSKIRDSKISLHCEPVDLFELVKMVVTLFEPMLKERKIVLVNNVPSSLNCVVADHNRLQQILYNLIGNAVKFTNEGTIEINAIDKNDRIEIAIKDSGIGIAKDKLEVVFNSFEQGETVIERGISGTGLGLAVTKQLVELHGGEIELESRLGVGSIFRFSLQKSAEGVVSEVNKKNKIKARGDGLSNAVVGAAIGTGIKSLFTPLPGLQDQGVSQFEHQHILVVDDEPVNRLVLDGFLKFNQYRITECSSGAEALTKIAQSGDISLVLLDVMMPGMDGYQTCRKIREKYNSRQLPVIFLSGKNQREDIDEGFAAGGNDFLHKPIAKDELLIRVETHLRLVKLQESILASSGSAVD